MHLVDRGILPRPRLAHVVHKINAIEGDSVDAGPGLTVDLDLVLAAADVKAQRLVFFAHSVTR